MTIDKKLAAQVLINMTSVTGVVATGQFEYVDDNLGIEGLEAQNEAVLLAGRNEIATIQSRIKQLDKHLAAAGVTIKYP